MTTNTPENKAAFFAQYWGQKIGIIKDFSKDGLTYVNDYFLITPKDRFLELTPLSSITDEDTKEAKKLMKDRMSAFDEFFKKPTLSGSIAVIDYLRSRGYLIGWRDLTPEQIISYGWAKIKQR